VRHLRFRHADAGQEITFDLSKGHVRGRRTHLPAERSPAIFCFPAKPCRALLDWTDEDICPYVVLALRRLVLRFPALLADWMLWALTIALINPGKRWSISAQREVLRISTPMRSPRIKPASRSALKCWERVDLGMSFSLMWRKSEQLWEQFESTIWEKMATRTGSESACIMPSTVTSSTEG
jgi:hypothetical protein